MNSEGKLGEVSYLGSEWNRTHGSPDALLNTRCKNGAKKLFRMFMLYYNVYYIFYCRLVAITVVIIGYLGGNDCYCDNTFVTRYSLLCCRGKASVTKARSLK